MSGNPNKMQLFISHSSKNKEKFVEALVACLEKYEYDIWLDKHSIPLSESIFREILKGVKQSDVGIIVLSKEFLSPESKWTTFEFGMLINSEKPLYFLLYKISPDEVATVFPFLADLNGIQINDVKDIEKVTEILIKELIKVQEKKLEEYHISKETTISCLGKLLYKDFKPSLLSINVSKYLVYDRYSNIKIWIGNPQIISELNKIEYKFNEITKGQYSERKWENTDVRELKNGEINKRKAKLIVIDSVQDYNLLQNSIIELQNEIFVIICFNIQDISISKIYAYDFFNKLASKKIKVPVLIEDNIHIKQSINKSLSLYSLFQIILEYVPEKTRLFLKLLCEKELSNSDFLKFVAMVSIQNPLINFKSIIFRLLCIFGSQEHRKKLIHNLENEDNPELIFAEIKDDLYSITEFLNIAKEDQLKAIVEISRRDILLLLVAGLKSGVKIEGLKQLLVKFGLTNYGKVNLILNKENCSQPKNTIDLWITKELYLQTYQDFIKTIEYSHINNEMNYVRLMTEEHNDNSLKQILENEDLRFGFKIINFNELNLQKKEKFKIDELLYINKI